MDLKQVIEEVSAGQATLLDVRRDDEWAEGHAEQAVHFPVERIEAGEVPSIDKDKKVYTYCKAGGRATKAAKILKIKGYKDPVSIGGLVDWQAAGGSVTK